MGVQNVVVQTHLQFPLLQSFFGPVHNWRESILEEFFLLQLHLNMSHSEVRSLPIRYRRWYLDRLARHFKEQNERYNKDSTQNQDNLGAIAEFEKQINSKLS